MITLDKIKMKLYGPAFTQLMHKKKTNKYRVAKATGVPYQTLSNWEAGRFRPNDKNAEIVAGYLGLIYHSEEVAKLRKQAREIQDKLEKFT